MNAKRDIPSDLEQWLEMATEGIAAAGKERIGREIGAHYAEAVAAHEGKGMTEEQAREKALEELGSRGPPDDGCGRLT